MGHDEPSEHFKYVEVVQTFDLQPSQVSVFAFIGQEHRLIEARCGVSAPGIGIFLL